MLVDSYDIMVVTYVVDIVIDGILCDISTDRVVTSHVLVSILYYMITVVMVDTGSYNN